MTLLLGGVIVLLLAVIGVGVWQFWPRPKSVAAGKSPQPPRPAIQATKDNNNNKSIVLAPQGPRTATPSQSPRAEPPPERRTISKRKVRARRRSSRRPKVRYIRPCKSRKFGWLRITTSQCQLSQKLSNNSLKKFPANRLVQMRPGSYKFRCYNYRKRLERWFSARVRTCKTTTVRKNYRKGSLFIKSPANVYLPGFGKLGRSPDLIELYEGTYTILIKPLNGSGRRKQTVRIRAGRTTKLQ